MSCPQGPHGLARVALRTHAPGTSLSPHGTTSPASVSPCEPAWARGSEPGTPVQTPGGSQLPQCRCWVPTTPKFTPRHGKIAPKPQHRAGGHPGHPLGPPPTLHPSCTLLWCLGAPHPLKSSISGQKPRVFDTRLQIKRENKTAAENAAAHARPVCPPPGQMTPHCRRGRTITAAAPARAPVGAKFIKTPQIPPKGWGRNAKPNQPKKTPPNPKQTKQTPQNYQNGEGVEGPPTCWRRSGTLTNSAKTAKKRHPEIESADKAHFRAKKIVVERSGLQKSAVFTRKERGCAWGGAAEGAPRPVGERHGTSRASVSPL